MLQRILEPEVMDDAQEAWAYDAMDHSAVNENFVSDLLEFCQLPGCVLDVGTGTARIPILVCRHQPSVTMVACDASASMLEIARFNLKAANLENRIQLRLEDVKKLSFADGAFDCTVSNSLIHHLSEPSIAVGEMVRVTRTGGRLFVRDLSRPDDNDEIERLVARHAGGEDPESQQLFRQSLAAALTAHEMQQIVSQFGFSSNTVRSTSDRHWTWTAVR